MFKLPIYNLPVTIELVCDYLCLSCVSYINLLLASCNVEWPEVGT